MCGQQYQMQGLILESLLILGYPNVTRMSHIYVQFQGVGPKNVIFSIGPRQEQESQIFYWILALCVYINVGAKPLFNRDMIFEI